MLGIGIIGCGKIAQVRHIPEYEANPDAKIVALYDLNFERAQELAEKLGAIACKSLDELLALPEVDAVSVCTANFVHAENTIAALRAHKHVLCEKPMAETSAQCQEMVDVAKAEGMQLMIDQNQRMAMAHKKAKELLEAGAIGRPLTFKTTFAHGGPETWSIDPGTASWFFDKKRAAMGAMGDLGVHKIDLIQYLLGDKITRVAAKVTTLDKHYTTGELVDVDDNALCLMEFESGMVGTLTVSWTNYGQEQNSTVIFGTEGVMRIYEDPAYSIVLENRDGTRTLYELEGIQTNDNQTASGVIDAFVDALQDGVEVPISGESVLHAMKVVDACLASAETSSFVDVK